MIIAFSCAKLQFFPDSRKLFLPEWQIIYNFACKLEILMHYHSLEIINII